MSILYRIGYNAAVLGITALDMLLDVVGPPCDCAHHTEPGDVLTIRTERGQTFARFRGVDEARPRQNGRGEIPAAPTGLYWKGEP